jgi:Ca-activated chloride channel family protein
MRVWTVFGLCVLLPAAASAAASVAAPWVTIMSPNDGAEALGEIEIRAAAGPEDVVTMVEFLIDGQPVGSLSTPPYDFRVDLGGANRVHRIEVVARSADGQEARDAVSTRPIPIAAEYEVELQQLYVTVSRDGGRVLDLDQDAFAIVDEQRRQEMVTFARGEIPFTASILIDASSSMQGDKLEAAVAGARAFLEGARPLDQVQLTVFSDVTKIHTPIGAGPEVMMAGLGWVRAQGGTAIADHLWTSMRLLERRQGRRVVVLLSDGIDTHSVLDMEAVLQAARRSQALVYWIKLEGPRGSDTGSLYSAWKNADAYRRQMALLDQVVVDSGGRVFPVRSAGSIEAVFLSVLAELREQYVLGYYPSHPHNDGRWHEVQVLVEGGYEIRTSRGYMDY